MKSLASLFLSFACAVAALPAFAQTLYSNTGPYTDTGSPFYAYGVYNFSQDTTDSFTLGSSATVSGASFILWEYQSGATPLTSWDLDYSIGTSPFGSQVEAGTGVTPTSSDYLNPIYVSANNTSYYANLVTISIPNIDLGPGTYWLTLADTTNTQNFYTFWDASWPVSEGPSTAYFHSTFTTVPSETFTIFGPTGPTSLTSPTAVPEYSPFDLPAAIGVLAMALLFHKRIAAGGSRRTT
jgi:hypothetical protein